MTRHWLICLVALGLSVALGQAAAKRPNVLFIAIDDLNDWVGCLGGHPQVRTPDINRLARRGVLFSNAHCQAPICNPSRTSFMTGLRPSTTGIYENRPWFRTTALNRDRVTLTEHFSANGYETFTAGKIFHGTAAYDKDSWDTYFKPAGSKLPLAKRDNGLPKSAWAPSSVTVSVTTRSTESLYPSTRISLV